MTQLSLPDFSISSRPRSWTAVVRARGIALCLRSVISTVGLLVFLPIAASGQSSPVHTSLDRTTQQPEHLLEPPSGGRKPKAPQAGQKRARLPIKHATTFLAQQLEPVPLRPDPTKTEAPAALVEPATFSGKELFVIHSGATDTPAQRRAQDLSVQLDKVISDQHFDPSKLRVKFFPDHNAIVYGDTTLVTITQTDAGSEATGLEALSEHRLAILRAIIDSERAKRNLNDAIDQVRFGTVKSNLLYLLGNPLSLRIGISVLGLFILIVVTYSVRRSIPKYFHESYKRYTVSKIAEFSSYFLGLVFLSIVFSDTLGSLAVIIGAATAGIALALKELIVSMAGWLAITFGDTYRVGDRVQIAGIKGDVIDVGLVRTTLMELGEWVAGDLYTGRIVRVANGSIFAGPTFNYTRDLTFLWDEVVISVTNDSDYEAMRSIIENVVKEVVGDYVVEAKLGWERLKEKYLVEDEKIDPLVTFAILEKSISFTARYPVDFRQRRIVKDELFTGILKEIRKQNGRIKLLAKD